MGETSNVCVVSVFLKRWFKIDLLRVYINASGVHEVTMSATRERERINQIEAEKWRKT